MRTITNSECKALQIRHKDHWGNKHPYKGRYHDSGSVHLMEPTELPEGWVFVCIPSWGLYVRKIDDQDYYEDL